jgi:hypothetical protein
MTSSKAPLAQQAPTRRTIIEEGDAAPSIAPRPPRRDSPKASAQEGASGMNPIPLATRGREPKGYEPISPDEL